MQEILRHQGYTKSGYTKSETGGGACGGIQKCQLTLKVLARDRFWQILARGRFADEKTSFGSRTFRCNPAMTNNLDDAKICREGKLSILIYAKIYTVYYTALTK